MRILCLHGIGINPDILASQTANFRALLPSHYEYTFISGEESAPAADGIGSIYPGPYLAFYSLPTVSKLQLAHELIWEVIQESGPWDGVIGFSQGAALAASVLIHHQLEKPSEPPPFRFAVFIGASLPFSTSRDIGVDISQVWSSTRVLNGDLRKWVPASVKEKEGEIHTIEQAARVLSKADNEQKREGNDPLSDSQMRQFHPDSIPTLPRISIPVAHVYGRKDPYYTQSLALVRLCDQTLSTIFEHDDGHCIPRNQRVSQCIANAIEKTAFRADLSC